MMTRNEMIKFLRENPGVKVTHRLFSEDEYIYHQNGKVYDENRYLFEDWYTPEHNGIRMRVGDVWETGWSIKE